MKKQNIFKLLLLFLVSSSVFAQVQKAQTLQVGNTSANTPKSSAALQIDDTARGFLPPRMTQVQRIAISGPVPGLMVWCLDCGVSGEMQVYNGTAWTNLLGNSASFSRPNAPTNLIGTSGNTQASIAFTAPVSNGGSVISGYTVTSSPGSFTATGTTSPLVVTGLTNGTSYTFTAIATNAIGNSVASAASSAVIPSTTPGAPTSLIATRGNTQASIAFTAPVSNGGSVITGYTVTSSPGSFTATGAASPIVISGLTNGTAYTFTAIATNGIGNSVASSASLAVTPATVPFPPTAIVATEGNTNISIAFTPPVNNGGSAITGYTVTSSPGNYTVTGSSSPLLINVNSGLSYTFTVVATNATGNSIASTPSVAFAKSCGVYVAAGVWKKMMCHNLGADTTVDPNVYSPGVIGNYYQWGRTTPFANNITGTAVGVWNATPAADGAWSDISKTSNDPCPAGYRIPTIDQWRNIALNNGLFTTASNGPFGTIVHIGPNSNSSTTTVFMAGYYTDATSLSYNTIFGQFWSSTSDGLSNAIDIAFGTLPDADGYDYSPRTYGMNIRCIQE